MGTYPTSPRSDFINWCTAHSAVFTAHAAAIGLTPAQVNAFKAALADAQSADGEQNAAKQTAKAATTKATQNFAVLRKSAAEMVRTIKTFAENTEDPSVYATAQIPPPADPTTAPPPGKPYAVSAQLDTNTGAPILKWKASNPRGTAGTSYIVRRKLPSESAFTFVGVTGSKSFTDNTFIQGPDSVQYTIQGQRADRAGTPSDAFAINFGRQPGGSVFIEQKPEAVNAPRLVA